MDEVRAKGIDVNVTVENLGPCKKLLRFEVEASVVDAAFEEITSDVQRQAQLPGFRRGKAPRHLILRSYAAEIESEARRKLISDAFRKGVEQEKIRPVTTPDIEEIQFGKGQTLQFAATIETAPEFELPDYKGIPVRRQVAMVTEEDIDRAIHVLREQRATYIDVSRPVQEGDFVVVNYRGTCEGQAITAIAPTARGIEEKKGAWMQVSRDSFIPGFTDPLQGANAGETRTVSITFPLEFVAPALSGRKADYVVEVLQVKEKSLPELDDALAVAFGAENVAALREGVKRDLKNELDFKVKRSVRDQIAQFLLEKVPCELPESLVSGETKNVVYDIVRENSQRGFTKEQIDQQKDQIFAAASRSAKERVKAAFILGRIAEKEGIRAEQQELAARIAYMAEQYQIKPERLVRQLEERNGIAELRDQVLTSKVLDFLELHAQVEEVLPTNLPTS